MIGVLDLFRHRPAAAAEIAAAAQAVDRELDGPRGMLCRRHSRDGRSVEIVTRADQAAGEVIDP